MKIRMGVIGLGVGERHLHYLATNEFVEVVAICDFDNLKAKRLADIYGVKNICTDWVEMIESFGLQAIVIASYDQDHCTQVVKSLESGIHVFVEKPLCLTFAELSNIKQAYEKVNSGGRVIYLTSNFILRRELRFIELKNKIDSGALGEIYSIDASYDYGRISKLLEGWRAHSPNYSVMSGGGIHVIDLCQWLTSQSFVPKYAMQNKICTKSSAFVAPDFTTCLGLLGNNTVMKVTANFGSQTPHYHQIKIYGTKGSFFNICGDGFYFFDSEPNVKRIADPNPFPKANKADLLSNFLAAIMSKSRLDVTFEEIVRNMQISLKVDELASQAMK